MDRGNRSNSRLSPEKILEVVWHWIIESTLAQTAEILDLEDNTVSDWFSYCREVCEMLNQRHWAAVKLGDGQGQIMENQRQDSVIQIDESLLRGRRKYNRGRLLRGSKY